jgi:ornithine cyclodeaminase/alanine dehydrogenase-like protein (mu-crystallin family)
VIGCGRQARGQLAALRAALPTVARAVAWCPTATHLDAFCEDTGAEAAGSAQEAARCDVVVTATTSRDPVLRGDWLRPGALVCAAGANEPDRRELDAATLSRATFVCCESVEQARAEAGDLVETVAAGVLDWLEVHELHEVVAGDLRGRAADDDVVVFKASGTAAWDVALGVEAVRRARERVIGREL